MTNNNNNQVVINNNHPTIHTNTNTNNIVANPPLNNNNQPVVLINNNNLIPHDEIIKDRFIDFLFNGDENIDPSSIIDNPERIEGFSRFSSFLQNGQEF
ncbi:hypothetical protein Glove_428g62 [Diversispora epigaea]|uniref:Uncharacterized protein n=1 Tax=Diversispora epigaea TaxID=1348612 RepID=A0A397H1P4_9GLOM|nr:hypothetical protein Glove_428g62 [Diversispora epigaea]